MAQTPIFKFLQLGQAKHKHAISKQVFGKVLKQHEHISSSSAMSFGFCANRNKQIN